MTGRTAPSLQGKLDAIRAVMIARQNLDQSLDILDTVLCPEGRVLTLASSSEVESLINEFASPDGLPDQHVCHASEILVLIESVLEFE